MSTDNLGKQIKPIIIGMIIGGILTLGATYFITPSGTEQTREAAPEEKKPIYWVAPMDANYKRAILFK